MDYGQLVVFILTAGNCSACVNIKESGVMNRITDFMRSKGCRVVDKFLPEMRSNLVVETRIDNVINSNFKLWFPMFICIDRGMLDTIESGGNVQLSRVGVFNGSYKTDANKFVMDRTYDRMDESSFGRWLDECVRNLSFGHKVTGVQRPTIGITTMAHQVTTAKRDPTLEQEHIACDKINYKLRSRFHS